MAEETKKGCLSQARLVSGNLFLFRAVGLHILDDLDLADVVELWRILQTHRPVVGDAERVAVLDLGEVDLRLLPVGVRVFLVHVEGVEIVLRPRGIDRQGEEVVDVLVLPLDHVLVGFLDLQVVYPFSLLLLAEARDEAQGREKKGFHPLTSILENYKAHSGFFVVSEELFHVEGHLLLSPLLDKDRIGLVHKGPCPFRDLGLEVFFHRVPFLEEEIARDDRAEGDGGEEGLPPGPEVEGIGDDVPSDVLPVELLALELVDVDQAVLVDAVAVDEPFLGKIVAFGHHLVDVHPLLHKAAELVRGDEDGIAVRSFHERRSDLADVFVVELLGIVHPHFRKEGDVLLQDMASDDNEGAEEIPNADLVAPDLPGEVVPAFLDFLSLGMGGLFPCHGDVLGELEGLVDSLLPAGKDDRIDFLPVPVGGDMDLASLALEIVVGTLCRVDLLGLVEILDLLGLGQVDLYLCVNQCDDLICKNIAQICFLLLC